ncbi:P-loop containing nucleoside triphosphate hydrolase protein [Cenococcum geophilum 1.58]|uniref:P-loop containing nucleoside triphosphate hydrolase protein n=1 Tax=Cenococcum geophilum 1.58 TaxID=794803 RepID=A0ACC8ENA4_9PEZI|nr:P-loop containing nucleoside triphosphate hydrolase protein [Cenococcum geophilum 1.58]
MGATKEIALQSDEARKAAFEEFKQHCSGQRTSTTLSVIEGLRKTHPDHHVTAVLRTSCSLLEYAAAGKATATFDGNGEGFDVLRGWKSVGEGLEKRDHPGRLQDSVNFGRYAYTWEGREFVVYEVEWTELLRPPTQLYCVLAARTGANVAAGDSHCADTDALLLAAGKWTSQLHDEIYVFDDGYWAKNRELWTVVQGSSWDEVILDPDMKTQLIEDVQGFFDSQAMYKELAVPWKRGIIFHGVPGNGKTISIKALMSSLYARPDAIPSLYVKSFETCKGPQYSIRSIFSQARQSAPCLLIFEDLDSLVTDETRSYFLNEVDGLESNDGILMIGSTNHLDRLDQAISKRPSRFDRKYHFKLPGEQERAAYAVFWKKKLAKNHNIEFPMELCSIIGALTEGFSFAYLKELFVMALLTVARGGPVPEEEVVEPVGPVEKAAGVMDAEPAAGNEKVDMNGGENEATEAEKVEAPVKKRTMPEVEIPEELRENVLLKVIKHQIRTLLDEMDNTKEDDWPSEREKPVRAVRPCRMGPLSLM